MVPYRYFLCGAVGGEELCLKVLSLPLHTRAPLTGGLYLQPQTHHGHVIIPQNEEVCGAKVKKNPLATTTESMLNFSCFLNTKCHISLHVHALLGKYLLFYLLQRRLLNGTLHRLLLDGLHHLLRQRDILQNTNPPTISTCTTASLVMVRMTS